MHALEALTCRGLAVSATGTRLSVGPVCRLDDELRTFIHGHKVEILAGLDAWEVLASAINACCDARQDPEEHRSALLTDCYNCAVSDWPYLTSYFNDELDRWRNGRLTRNHGGNQ